MVSWLIYEEEKGSYAMAPSPAFPDFASLVEACTWQAQTQPHRIGFTFLADGEGDERNLTYEELDRQSRTLAAKLQTLGNKADRVVLLFAPGLEYVVGFYACIYAGMIAVPAYPPDFMRMERTFDRLRVILQDCQSRIILGTQSTLAEAAPFLPQSPQDLFIVPVDSWRDWLDLPWARPALTRDDLALLQYTSGSTSTPRGVQVSQGNLLYQVRELYRWAGEHFLGVSWLPLYHDLGLVGGVVCPLYSGRRIILMSPLSFMQRPMRWLEAISRYHATTSGGPNFAYDLCVRKFRPEESPHLDLTSWRFAVNGAEPVRAETLRRFSDTFAPFGFRPETWQPSYGLAEATLGVAGTAPAEPVVVSEFDGGCLELNQAVSATAASRNRKTIVSCGKPFVETEVAIVDPCRHTVCPAGTVGEIWVRGPGVAHGYWGRPDESQAVFQARTSDTDAGPYLRTGDLGFFHEGELYVTARLKELIILQGRNFYPHDIERTAAGVHSSLPAQGGAAFGIEQHGEEQLVLVHEVLRPGKLDLDALGEQIRQAILREQQAWLCALTFIKGGSLPKTSSGKVQRLEARRRFLDGTLAVLRQRTWPLPQMNGHNGHLSSGKSTPTAQAIQDWLVARLARHYQLSLDRIDVRQSIRTYVMDSVTLMMIAVDLESWLGRTISPLVLADGPTIAELARRLADVNYKPATSAATPPCAATLPVERMSEAELDRALAEYLDNDR
jgi:acyl-CoA synthetase (AMP-forming)/AMP-acid ligase II/acyl carrier protein